MSLPLLGSWQRFLYLEITNLDDDIVIARGTGDELRSCEREECIGIS